MDYEKYEPIVWMAPVIGAAALVITAVLSAPPESPKRNTLESGLSRAGSKAIEYVVDSGVEK